MIADETGNDLQWVEKYRPKSLEDLIINDNTRDMLRTYLDKGTIPNLMLAGTPGKGKTSLAEVLVAELGCDHLYINASQERGIDVVRSQIIEYADASAFMAKIKIVILDESDQMTPDAQCSLKNIIEKSSTDTRFIFTCNNVSKMDPAIRSRCTQIQIDAKAKDVFSRLLQILDKEEIKRTKDDEKIILTQILKDHWPDIRSMISHLEVSSATGEFSYVKYTSDKDVIEVVDYIFTTLNGSPTSVRKAREYWIKNSIKFNNQYDTLAKYVFNRAIDQIGSSEELDKINNYVVEFNHGGFDQEIIFTALVNRLGIALGKQNATKS